MRIGIIARSDNTGLGNQTRELVKMLKPSKIMLIDFTNLNGNKQHPEWYAGIPTVKTNGFATEREVLRFLADLDIVISCEIFYNNNLVRNAKKRGIKTILQYNYELFDYFQNPQLRLPDVLLSPSKWNIERVEKEFGSESEVLHLPPPSDFSLFSEARKVNLSSDHKRILHVAGKLAAKDRNGTETVLETMKHSKADFELVIKTQSALDFNVSDSRITIDDSNPDNMADLYVGFDAMVLPRRYAGLCLPMNEALMSGLPVFMTNISPNNFVLPPEWLVEAKVIEKFRTKTMIDLHEGDAVQLAKMIDAYVLSDKGKEKKRAVDIGFNTFSSDVLKEKYLELFNRLHMQKAQ